MNISAKILPLIENGVQPSYLVSIAFSNSSIYHNLKNEFVTLPGVILASVTGDIVPYRGKNYYFKPILGDYPSLSENIDILKGTLQPTQTQFTLSEYANFPESMLEIEGSSGIIVKIQLWFPSTELSDAITIFLGSVDSLKQNPITKTISISATDGEPNKRIKFPPDAQKLDSALFPKIPGNINGVHNRRSIIGNTNFPILCPQVDNGTLFYICDHPITLNSNFSVEVNGEKKESTDPDFGWSVSTYDLPIDYQNILFQPYPLSVLKFNNQITPDLQFVTCYNFKGLNPEKRPLLTLLEDYGNYKINSNARNIMNNLPLSIVSQVSDDLLNIVKNRLLGQTEYMMAWQQGEINLLPIAGLQSSIILKTKQALYDMVITENIQRTSESDIINHLEIGYSRNIFAAKDNDITRRFVRVNYENAPIDLLPKLQFSYHRYGPRYFRMDFADLDFEDRASYEEYISDIAAKILKITYKQSRIYSFYAPWYPAIAIPINTIVTLDAPEYNINMQSARLVGKQYTSYGYILKFQEEA